jgi:hypothetical protein
MRMSNWCQYFKKLNVYSNNFLSLTKRKWYTFFKQYRNVLQTDQSVFRN